jgi:hypothetical protein
MIPAQDIGGVFDAIQQVKAGAAAFCTNFFPVQRKLQEWVEHGELLVENRGEAAFFLRQDRDFWHFYFCARDVAALCRGIAALADLKSRRLTTDLARKLCTTSSGRWHQPDFGPTPGFSAWPARAGRWRLRPQRMTRL